MLLGAGASRDAELPLTEDLARDLVKAFDEELTRLGRQTGEQEQVVRALHLVYGAIVAHGTEQGSSPLTAVNVERLVSAVRLLRDRRTHEAAPFITSWRGSIEDVDDHPIPLRDRDLHIGLDHDLRLKTDGLAKDMAAIARAAISPGNGATFRRLEDQLLRRICDLLSQPSSVAYLHPLVRLAQQQPGGLDIATLNYDRTVELAAAECGVPLDTGFDRWQPGIPITFDMIDGHINLIKPHGSVDWIRETGSPSEPIPGHPLAQYRYRVGAPSPVGTRYTTDVPLIVIGDREKLETAGPTLALMRAFEEALHRASNLVVVGYSFGDNHINTVIRNWLAPDRTRTISILDPGWPKPEHWAIGLDTDLSLRDALRFDASGAPTLGGGRVIVTRKGAKEGLEEALAARPLGKIAAELTIMVCLDERPYIRVTNHGYELMRLTFRVYGRVARSLGRAVSAITSLRLTPDGTDTDNVLQINNLASNASVDIYFDRTPDSDGYASVTIYGENWARTINEHREIALGG